MELFLDLTTALGLALALGMRPFLPLLLVGALASNKTIVHLSGFYSFLADPFFLLAIVLVTTGFILLERRVSSEVRELLLNKLELGAALLAAAFVCAAILNYHQDTAWLGFIIGPVAALFSGYTVSGLLSRTRQRLDSAAASSLSVYADGAALITALIAVLLPPLSIILLIGCGFLLVSGRKSEAKKYAGLRILR